MDGSAGGSAMGLAEGESMKLGVALALAVVAASPAVSAQERDPFKEYERILEDDAKERAAKHDRRIRDTSVAYLRGLRRIRVVNAGVSEDVDGDPNIMSSKEVLDFLLLKLRANGVRSVSFESIEALTAESRVKDRIENSPEIDLDLSFTVIRHQDRVTYSFMFIADMREPGKTLRNGSSIFGSLRVFNDRRLGVAGVNAAKPLMREMIEEYVEKVASLWLEANPK